MTSTVIAIPRPASPRPAGNVWDANFFDDACSICRRMAAELTETFFEAEQPGLAVLGDVPGEQPFSSPIARITRSRSTRARARRSSSRALTMTTSASHSLTTNGDVLGYSSADASNYTDGLNNFVAPDDGTYYVEMTGNPGVKFNLVVTRGADFNTQPDNQFPSAQDITATELSGDNKLGGVLGYLQSYQWHRLLLGQCERRRQSGVHHHDSGRRPRRVCQHAQPRAVAVRPERQSRRRRRRQRPRRPELGDRLYRSRGRCRHLDHRGHIVAGCVATRASTAC